MIVKSIDRRLEKLFKDSEIKDVDFEDVKLRKTRKARKTKGLPPSKGLIALSWLGKYILLPAFIMTTILTILDLIPFRVIATVIWLGYMVIFLHFREKKRLQGKFNTRKR